MKSRFTTLDLCASVTELSQRLVGMRVINVYDIDNKTYLIKLQKPDEKAMLLIESGNRIHTTDFEWPKSTFPSGFAIKLRKHLKQKRLVALTQLGIDRIIDLQFGSEDFAHHLIIELYDRGNIVLTDGSYTILNLLRRRIEKTSEEGKSEMKGADGNDEGNPSALKEDEGQDAQQKQDGNKENKGSKGQERKKGKNTGPANDDVQFSVGQVYPVELAKKRQPLVSLEKLKEIMEEIMTSKKGEPLKKALNPYFIYGHMLLEHCLYEVGFPATIKIGDFNSGQDLPKVMDALVMADSFIDKAQSQVCKGYIIQKKEKKPCSVLKGVNSEETEITTFQEFHPFLLSQHASGSYSEYPSFDKAVDEFFSNIESQKVDVKALNQEKLALKKVENVKHDHEKRLKELKFAQDQDIKKAELIEVNLPLVDQAIQIVNSAIANQIDWTEIKNIVKEAQMQENPVACAIKELKLDTNHITLMLRDPFDDSDSEEEEEREGNEKKNKKKKASKGFRIDINLALSAYANAQSFYKKKKQSAVKEQRTIDQSQQALKSAHKKAQQTIKEVATTTSIRKARKTYWFEKFQWFISSENYLVIGGRDQQQNELIVKRHLTPGDVYVHADLHGASSVIVINKPGKHPIPPKTLQEAGAMAVCYSAAWESKIVTSAWWVYHDQVSKTAPTGEYLTTGSFMIRGKKNFLPPTHLIMGFGFLLRLDESCIEHHLNERRVRGVEEDSESIAESNADTEIDEELPLDDEDSDTETKDQENEVHNDQNNTETTENDTKDKEEEKEETLYPDTSIGLKLVSGKIKLNRETSTSSSIQDDDDYEIFLGDDSKLNLRENKEKANLVTQQRMAKMKPEDKKAKKKKQQQQQQEKLEDEQTKQKGPPQKKEQQQQQQQKRGQKAKLNKMKEKYGDQDEDERRMRMEILASAGEKKETKAEKRRQKKQNKTEKGSRAASSKRNPRQPNITPLPWELEQHQSEAAAQTEASEKDTEEVKLTKPESERMEKKEAIRTEAAIGDDDDDENEDEEFGSKDTFKENVSLLDTLTGCPVSDDTLLFAVPVCAPYSAMTNYKFKVKMTPGQTKKGKATKIALNAFIHSKDANQREKDLLKSVKDVDLSKYIPGKVKVSAPNLSKLKKK